MNYTDKNGSNLKIYEITGIIALIYSALLIIFSIYKQFFYIDGTWFHGFTSNGFAVLSGVIWIGVLFIFKRFLNQKLNYKKADSLINTYLIFLGITTFALGSVVFKSIKVYTSLENADNATSLFAFASTSILSVILLFISNFAIIIICILLGNRIRKIDLVEDKLFKILGISFIIYGVLSILSTINIIENDMIQFLIKAVLAVLVGLILRKNYNVTFSNLTSSSTEFKTNFNQPKSEPLNEILTEKPIAIIEKPNTQSEKKSISRKKEINTEYNEIPKINLNELEDKEMVLSYFENLSKEELNRLELIVSKEYNLNLTDDQKTDLIINHIAKNKLYDHQRFFPK